MRLFIFVFGLIFLVACGNSGTGLPKKLEGSDSLVIRFHPALPDTTAILISTSDQDSINQVIRLVSTDKITIPTCNYDANLSFYKKGALSGDLSVNFTAEKCYHFILLDDGKLTAIRLSNKAKALLQRLAANKSW